MKCLSLVPLCAGPFSTLMMLHCWPSTQRPCAYCCLPLRFQCVQWKCKSALNFHFIFHFDVMAAISLCLVIYQYRSNKLDRKLKWIVLIQFICWIINRMCLYTATCISAPFLHFQWTLWNIAIYRNIHRIAIYRDVIVSWPTYRDLYTSRSPCQYPALDSSQHIPS